MSNKFYKGDVVAVRRNAAMWRPRTHAEHQAWRDSDASKGMNSAGESKLDSPSRYKRDEGHTYTVTRGRVSCQKGWQTVSKCAQVRDSEGVLWYVFRKDLVQVG